MSLSERRAYSIVGADRKMVRYRSGGSPETALPGRRRLANEPRRFAYRPLFVLLRQRESRLGSTGLPAGSRGRARRSQPAASPQGCRQPGPDPDKGQAQCTVVAGLRPRPVRQRRALPYPRHRRRWHQGMSGRHSGHGNLRTARRLRTHGDCRATRQARNDRVRLLRMTCR